MASGLHRGGDVGQRGILWQAMRFATGHRASLIDEPRDQSTRGVLLAGIAERFPRGTLPRLESACRHLRFPCRSRRRSRG